MPYQLQLPLPLLPKTPANDNAPSATLHSPSAFDAPAMDTETFRRRVIQAVQERRVCRAVYRGPDGVPRARSFEPYAMIRVGEHWTVFGYCRLRQSLRTFRSDRVLAFDLLDELFTPKHCVSLERFILRRRGVA